jgi:hypothetical protein
LSACRRPSWSSRIGKPSSFARPISTHGEQRTRGKERKRVSRPDLESAAKRGEKGKRETNNIVRVESTRIPWPGEGAEGRRLVQCDLEHLSLTVRERDLLSKLCECRLEDVDLGEDGLGRDVVVDEDGRLVEPGERPAGDKPGEGGEGVERGEAGTRRAGGGERARQRVSDFDFGSGRRKQRGGNSSLVRRREESVDLGEHRTRRSEHGSRGRVVGRHEVDVGLVEKNHGDVRDAVSCISDGTTVISLVDPRSELVGNESRLPANRSGSIPPPVDNG